MDPQTGSKPSLQRLTHSIEQSTISPGGGCTIMPISLAAIEAARRHIAGPAIRTPLVRLNTSDAPAEIYLKLENLQPIGSFKIRGAANAMAHLPKEQLQRGVVTASAGKIAEARNSAP